ncbi:MAG TPA: Cys-tRNA(Pro) deacylase [Acidimicrobiales bacterium]
MALRRAGVTFKLHEYDHTAVRGWGLEAADALGLDPTRVFKTIMCEADGRPVVAVVPVAAQVSLKALAVAAGAKRADLMEPDKAQRRTGYVLGGISPFGQKQSSHTVVDDSALEAATMYVSGGRRGLEIEIYPADLVKLLSASVAAITA